MFVRERERERGTTILLDLLTDVAVRAHFHSHTFRRKKVRGTAQLTLDTVSRITIVERGLMLR